jgi:hypothetical protein
MVPRVSGQRGRVLSIDDGPNVELSPTTLHREERAGLRRAALFVPRFRRGRGGEFLEARVIPERIEHRIEPEQRRSERHVFVQCARARYREHLL